MSPQRLVAALTAPILGLSALLFCAPSASAATCPDGAGGCGAAGAYTVVGTDGTLALQSSPNVGNVVGWAHEGQTLQIFCQVNDGGTDYPDNLWSHTWDKVLIAIGKGNPLQWVWVYDHFINTPLQNADGWSLAPRC